MTAPRLIRPRPDRRGFLAGATACLAALGATRALAAPEPPPGPDSGPLDLAPAGVAAFARQELDRLGPAIRRPERVAVADFGRPSWQPRLYLVDMIAGGTTSLLVAHGCGSDPDFSGWLRSFSNTVESQSSCEGAFRTLGRYEGAHGRSMRLEGLDPTNSNALRRDIVIHAARYVGPSVIQDIGRLGWSEGCFAIYRGDLTLVLDSLPPGSLLISTRFTPPPLSPEPPPLPPTPTL